jgi:hypothetical protein
MATTVRYQYSPNQAGLDHLKTCETYRKILRANIDPFMPLEAKIEAKARIRAMDYNELRDAVKALNKH